MKRHALIASAIAACASPAFAQVTQVHSNHAPSAQTQPAADHAGHDMSQMDNSARRSGDAGAHDMTAMAGAFGSYAMTRDASGTSWQPDAASHDGVHAMSGGWMLMGHATLDGVYSWQDGPRGDDKGFLAGMVMGSARRDFANGDKIQLRAMLSPDPFMGKSGYPLLLAAGETADGEETLIDRQHPHDLFMELSASYAKRLTETDSVFVYGGLPGEPAFGPPAFMHRPAAIDSPEAPITHHWLDSTHITFGVVTAGWIHDRIKLEASRFRGREPDQNRYDIETGALDSTAVRVSWNPTPNWALQASWAEVISPEQLEPDADETRYSASALYTQKVGSGDVSITAAVGRKESSEGGSLDAWLGEASWSPSPDWTIFSRAEHIETDELGADHHGPVETAAKLSLGLVRDWRIADHVEFGISALVSLNSPNDTLDTLYGENPLGAMGFVRLKIG